MKWPVPEPVRLRARLALDYLGLEMRIIDLREDHNGNLVWFEVNPPGQFIYLDGVVGLHITAKIRRISVR